jgi:diadenosine tetraphosphate (Ap4A) HIT family hydrolase
LLGRLGHGPTILGAVEWPDEFYALRRGEGCPMCAEGRPDSSHGGARIFAGEVADAYLSRDDIQRGYTIVTWRGRHVAEPTELEPGEAAAYWLEVLRVGGAIERAFGPVKMNYDVLGNSVPHLHTHVVPRYADDPKPGWPFPFPDEASPIVEAVYQTDVEALRALLT